MSRYTENPVKAQNKQMREMYAKHLCLHCKYLNYWDWYICGKRKFNFFDFYLKEHLRIWKRRLEWEIGDVSFQYLVKHFFDIDQFIPDKPIKKCKFYEYSDRKVFWTQIVESDGTTWTDNGE